MNITTDLLGSINTDLEIESTISRRIVNYPFCNDGLLAWQLQVNKVSYIHFSLMFSAHIHKSELLPITHLNCSCQTSYLKNSFFKLPSSHQLLQTTLTNITSAQGSRLPYSQPHIKITTAGQSHTSKITSSNHHPLISAFKPPS